MTAATLLYGAIFGEARLDLSKTTSLVIVPDSWLWYMPFEMLVTQGGKPGNLLADRVPLHYGPTAALAAQNIDHMSRALRAGKNVVSTAMTPFVYPKSCPRSARRLINPPGRWYRTSSNEACWTTRW